MKWAVQHHAAVGAALDDAGHGHGAQRAIQVLGQRQAHHQAAHLQVGFAIKAQHMVVHLRVQAHVAGAAFAGSRATTLAPVRRTPTVR